MLRPFGIVALAIAASACIEVAPTTLWTEATGGDGGAGGSVQAGGGGNGASTAAPLPPCSPTVPEPCARVVELDAGRHFTCARFDDGAMRCWGGNDAGQLGVTTLPSSAWEPPTLTTLPDFEQVATGHAHSCGLADGEVFCWGANHVGQLGAMGGNSAKAQHVAVPPALGLTTKNYTTCAQTTQGVFCWGLDINGQSEWPPGRAGTFSAPFLVDELQSQDVLAVQVSYQHACALLADHEVRCWGRGQAYRLGTGNEDDQLSPTPVLKTYPDPVHTLALGHEYGCVIAGTPPAAYCWGYFNSFHYYAAGPVAYDGWINKPYLDVQLGFRVMCVLYADQTVRCAGTNKAGLIPPSDEDQEAQMLQIPDLGNVTQIAMGRYHVCALNTDNEVRCWGRNAEGELGRGFLSAEETPAPVLWEAP